VSYIIPLVLIPSRRSGGTEAGIPTTPSNELLRTTLTGKRHSRRESVIPPVEGHQGKIKGFGRVPILEAANLELPP